MNTKIKNEVMEIKHMAFAVEDIEQSLQYYKKFMGISKDIKIQDMPKSKTRVAVFNIGKLNINSVNLKNRMEDLINGSKKEEEEAVIIFAMLLKIWRIL